MKKYIVRDIVNRRYLSRPLYTGRTRIGWGTVDEVHMFRNRAEAASCASNINARTTDAATAPRAVVMSVG